MAPARSPPRSRSHRATDRAPAAARRPRNAACDRGSPGGSRCRPSRDRRPPWTLRASRLGPSRDRASGPASCDPGYCPRRSHGRGGTLPGRSPSPPPPAYNRGDGRGNSRAGLWDSAPLGPRNRYWSSRRGRRWDRAETTAVPARRGPTRWRPGWDGAGRDCGRGDHRPRW